MVVQFERRGGWISATIQRSTCCDWRCRSRDHQPCVATIVLLFWLGSICRRHAIPSAIIVKIEFAAMVQVQRGIYVRFDTRLRHRNNGCVAAYWRVLPSRPPNAHSQPATLFETSVLPTWKLQEWLSHRSVPVSWTANPRLCHDRHAWILSR